MVSEREIELIVLDVALRRDKSEFRVKIDTPELEKIYQTIKAETDEIYAQGGVYDFPRDAAEAPDFEPVKDLD